MMISRVWSRRKSRAINRPAKAVGLAARELERDAQGFFSPGRVGAVSGELTHAQKIHHGNCIARGKCPVNSGLFPGDQGFVVIGGHEKAALPLIFVMLRQNAFELEGLGKPADVMGGLVEIQKGGNEKSIVLQIGRVAGPAFLVAAVKPAVDHHVF